MAAKTDTVTPFVHASNLRFDYASGWTLKVDAFAAAQLTYGIGISGH